MLRILLDEPNVLILDEPTNDLDVETLTVLEDFLDSWPGVVVTVTHDRYFLERVSDMVYAIMGDGRVRHLPRGVDQYLDELDGRNSAADAVECVDTRRWSSNDLAPRRIAVVTPVVDAAAARAAKKELNRIERQLAKLTEAEAKLHDQLAVQCERLRAAGRAGRRAAQARRRTRRAGDRLVRGRRTRRVATQSAGMRRRSVLRGQAN